MQPVDYKHSATVQVYTPRATGESTHTQKSTGNNNKLQPYNPIIWYHLARLLNAFVSMFTTYSSSYGLAYMYTAYVEYTQK